MPTDDQCQHIYEVMSQIDEAQMHMRLIYLNSSSNGLMSIP